MLSFITRTFSPFRAVGDCLLFNFRYLYLGSILCAEPLKKKKRVDPQHEQNRVRRKAKRIEREIKRLAKQGLKLKPIEEIEGDRQLLKEESERRRQSADVSETEVDRQALIMKEWTRYQFTKFRDERKKLNSVTAAQTKALKLLSITSPELYLSSIQPCLSILGDGAPRSLAVTLPMKFQGPFHTPPLSEDVYEAPDGDVVDTTQTYDYEFSLDRKFVADPRKSKFVLVKSSKIKKNVN